MPPESFVDVRRAAYVVPRWIAVASKDIGGDPTARIKGKTIIRVRP